MRKSKFTIGDEISCSCENCKLGENTVQGIVVKIDKNDYWVNDGGMGNDRIRKENAVLVKKKKTHPLFDGSLKKGN